jgi:histone-lysine N-methyltransferase SETMAR
MSSYALADELGEDKTTILRVLKNQLGLTRISRRWVPHEPTPDLMRNRCQGAVHLLESLSSLGPVRQNHVVTGDQTWVFLRNEPTHKWAKCGTDVPVRVKRLQGEKKLMLTVFFSRRGVLVIDFLPEKEKLNSSHITTVILPSLVSKIKKTCQKSGAKGWLLHLDNAPCHNSRISTSEISDQGFERLPHPPYSPDLAPSDFALFGYLKSHLQSFECESPDDLRHAVKTILETIPSNWFEKVWDEWLCRLRWVVENSGKYYTI